MAIMYSIHSITYCLALLSLHAYGSSAQVFNAPSPTPACLPRAQTDPSAAVISQAVSIDNSIDKACNPSTYQVSTWDSMHSFYALAQGLNGGDYFFNTTTTARIAFDTPDQPDCAKTFNAIFSACVTGQTLFSGGWMVAGATNFTINYLPPGQFTPASSAFSSASASASGSTTSSIPSVAGVSPPVGASSSSSLPPGPGVGSTPSSSSATTGPSHSSASNSPASSSAAASTSGSTISSISSVAGVILPVGASSSSSLPPEPGAGSTPSSSSATSGSSHSSASSSSTTNPSSTTFTGTAASPGSSVSTGGAPMTGSVYSLDGIAFTGNPSSLVSGNDTLVAGGIPLTMGGHTFSIPASATSIYVDGTLTALPAAMPIQTSAASTTAPVTSTITDVPANFTVALATNPTWTGNTWTTSTMSNGVFIFPVIVGCKFCGGRGGGIILINYPPIPNVITAFWSIFPKIPSVILSCFPIPLIKSCASSPPVTGGENPNPPPNNKPPNVPDPSQKPSVTQPKPSQKNSVTQPSDSASTTSKSSTSSESSSRSSQSSCTVTKTVDDCLIVCGPTITASSTISTCYSTSCKSTITNCDGSATTKTCTASWTSVTSQLPLTFDENALNSAFAAANSQQILWWGQIGGLDGAAASVLDSMGTSVPVDGSTSASKKASTKSTASSTASSKSTSSSAVSSSASSKASTKSLSSSSATSRSSSTSSKLHVTPASTITSVPPRTTTSKAATGPICRHNPVNQDPPNCIEPSSSSVPFTLSCSAGSNLGAATFNPATWCGCNTNSGTLYATMTTGKGHAACAYTAIPKSVVHPTAVPVPSSTSKGPPPATTTTCNVHVWEGEAQSPGFKQVYLNVIITVGDPKGPEIGGGHNGFSWGVTLDVDSGTEGGTIHVTPVRGPIGGQQKLRRRRFDGKGSEERGEAVAMMERDLDVSFEEEVDSPSPALRRRQATADGVTTGVISAVTELPPPRSSSSSSTVAPAPGGSLANVKAVAPIQAPPLFERGPVNFAIGDQHWDSTSSQCHTGHWDNGNANDFFGSLIFGDQFIPNRQMDCLFKCVLKHK